MKHLLVTNDFPPKIGGIQSYLWELWRRLPADDVTVFTTRYEGAAEFDAQQAFRVERSTRWWFLPTHKLAQEVNALADEVGAELVILDPALPLGLIGPRLERPYVILGHGAEIAIPAKVPIAATALHRVLRHSQGLVASGSYVAGLGQRWTSLRGKHCVSIPPGVDSERFKPLSAARKAEARAELGLPLAGPLVVGVSRLVPRKGFDRLIKAAAILRRTHPDVTVAIAGKGREADRLKKMAVRLDAPVVFLGRVDDELLPSLYGCGDVFSMPCHDRWFGLEREGFGIVFVEAAAAGVPCVAGLSGGSAEAVEHGRTGFVVGGRVKPEDVARSIATLLDDEDLRRRFSERGRERAASEFSYDALASELTTSLERIAASIS